MSRNAQRSLSDSANHAVVIITKSLHKQGTQLISCIYCNLLSGTSSKRSVGDVPYLGSLSKHNWKNTNPDGDEPHVVQSSHWQKDISGHSEVFVSIMASPSPNVSIGLTELMFERAFSHSFVLENEGKWTLSKWIVLCLLSCLKVRTQRDGFAPLPQWCSP